MNTDAYIVTVPTGNSPTGSAPAAIIYHIMVSDYMADGSRFYHVVGPCPPDGVSKGHFKTCDEMAHIRSLVQGWHPSIKNFQIEKSKPAKSTLKDKRMI